MNSTKTTQIYNGHSADLHWAYTMVWLSEWAGTIRSKRLKSSTQAFNRLRMGTAPSLPPWFWGKVMVAGPWGDEIMSKLSMFLAQVLGKEWSKFPGAVWATEQWLCCPLNFTTAFRTQTFFCFSLADVPILELSKEAAIPQHRPINSSVFYHSTTFIALL